MNWEIPSVQAGFRKGRGARDQISNTQWIIEKAKEFQKNIHFCFIDYTKAFDCGSQQTGKFLKRWQYQKITLLASCKTCMQVKKQQLEPDMKQWSSSELGNEYVTAVYCHPVWPIYMLSTSQEMLGWMNHKLESRWLQKYQQPQLCRW